MIGAILTGYKVVKGFMGAYKWVMAAIAIAGFLTTVFVYIDNHGEMRQEILALEARESSLLVNIDNLGSKVAECNGRIVNLNAERRADAENAQAKLLAAADRATILRAQRDSLRDDLGVTRFETIEAIRDEEDFADWVDWAVPPAGWRLLDDAATGRITPQ